MSSYTATEKTLHKLYLSNYFISKSSLELEEILYGSKAKKLEIKEYVFISGLARSGTTALMNKIFSTGEYASLQYSNMPILFSPNMWNKKLKIDSHERAHKDGIIIDGNSPEEFDEYYWKVFLNDSYIKDGLLAHEVPQKVLDKYLTYVSLICLSKGKQKYISKNNNNILRLSSLKKIEGSKVVILFRDPISHASSLKKLHKSFSASQTEDPFALDYFNYLGHHEFGLGHKPFVLNPNPEQQEMPYEIDSLNYWLQIWVNYYQYLIENIAMVDLLISFEDLVQQPNTVFEYVGTNLDVNTPMYSDKKHTPSQYDAPDCDSALVKRANEIYENLNLLRKYPA